MKALFKASHEAIADLLHLLGRDVPRDLWEVIFDGIGSPAEEIVSLLPYQEELDLLIGTLLDKPVGILNDVGVEGPAQALVRGDEDNPNPVRLPFCDKGMIDPRERRGQDFHQFLDLFRIRPRRAKALLGPF